MASADLPTRDLVGRVKQRPTDDTVLRVSFFCGCLPLLGRANPRATIASNRSRIAVDTMEGELAGKPLAGEPM